MKIEHDNQRVDEKVIQKIWNEVTLILIDKYNIGILADMQGPTGINVVDGKKFAMAAEHLPILDNNPKVIAGIIASKINAPGEKVAYVAPYVWHSNTTLDPSTMTPKDPDVLRIGFVFK